MLTLRFSLSLTSTCSSRAALGRPIPLTRSFHPNLPVRSRVQLKPGAPKRVFQPSRSSILSQARAFSSHGAMATPKNGLGLGMRGAVGAATLVGASLGFASQRSVIECEAPKTSPIYSGTDPLTLPPPPQSSISIYELSFGTVCGVCAGVFIKKGVKAVAFVLGGVFVMLQYFTSIRLTRVDWGSAESRFNKVFYTSERDASGNEVRRTPTVYSLWNWLVDFLTADFPPRATFIAGMILGLRIG